MENSKVYGVTARIRRINDMLVDMSRSIYKRLGLDLEPNWHLLLLLIEEHESLSVCEIAKYLELSHPSVISIINAMEKRGYLIRSKDEKDSRRTLISLSSKAKNNMPVFKKSWEAIAEYFKEFVPEEFLDQLIRIENFFQNNDVVEDICKRIE
ncbi:MAG: MarR family transcriptional regulator [Marinifilaceae bacterium]|jgi:DNA-binding MarR family transcriptional regulator|nr:MarR family transcriptional regulator [Marinifilaceae bacterium]